jgi:hypothetical protein
MKTLVKTSAVNRKEKRNDVAELLHSFSKKYQEPDLSSAIEIRMSEANSLIRVIETALENKDYDESLFHDHVYSTTRLLSNRYEELQMLMGVYIDRTQKEKIVKESINKGLAHVRA